MNEISFGTKLFIVWVLMLGSPIAIYFFIRDVGLRVIVIIAEGVIGLILLLLCPNFPLYISGGLIAGAFFSSTFD